MLHDRAIVYPPHHLDGCSIVILRECSGWLGSRFEVVESGMLSYDGDCLTLEAEHSDERRVFTEAEQERILDVSENNRIRECEGYRLFLLLE